jgi:deazaflavin-dependent oxidoreductase (nitroreductase family)
MALEKFVKALDATDEVDLTVTGQRTGRATSRPVWFVRQGHTLWLVPVKGSESAWFKNLQANPTIRLAAGGVTSSGTARPVRDQARVRDVVESFRAKYGSDQVAKYYSNFDAAVEVPLAEG